MAKAKEKKIDLPGCWGEMISKLVGMLQASDYDLDAYHWTQSQFDRIGEFLDSLPVDDRLGFPPLEEYFAMQAEILTAESDDGDRDGELQATPQEKLLHAMDV